jgi:putative transposase
MNRAVEDLVLFREPTGYERFLNLLARAKRRYRIDLFAYCLMPNHWHLVVRAVFSGDLPKFMRWLTRVHAQRWRIDHDTVGRGAVYQGRYRAVPVSQDRHFLTVCRYVERNARRAGLAERSEAWPWSSASTLPIRNCQRPPLAVWPIPRPASWSELLNQPEPDTVLHGVRTAIRSSTPIGDEVWSESTAVALGLEHRPRGRTLRPRSGRISQDRGST